MIFDAHENTDIGCIYIVMPSVELYQNYQNCITITIL